MLQEHKALLSSIISQGVSCANGLACRASLGRSTSSSCVIRQGSSFYLALYSSRVAGKMASVWLATLFLTAMLTSTLAQDFACNEYTVRCGFRQGNRCIPKNWECDGTLECSADGSDEFPCGYTAGYVYVYKYSGHLYFPHKDVNMHIKTTIKLMKIDDDYIMKFENPKLSQSEEDSQNLLTDEEENAWKKEVKFQVKNNGEIANIYYDSSHPQDILNMKKAIISLFQVKLETQDDSMIHSYQYMETDVTGKCRVKYRTEREVVPSMGESKKLYKINVTRINDYTDCENRPLDMYQSMNSVNCDEQPGYTIPTSRMRTSCTLYIHEDKMSEQPVINSCESHERQELNIKSQSEGPLVMLLVKKYLKLEKMMVESHQTPKIWNTRSSVLFSFDGLYRKDNNNVVDQVKATLDRLNELVNEETKAWDLISAEAPSLYSKLIGQLKWRASDTTFSDIYQQYFNEEKYRVWLESALPFVGTNAAGEEIKDKIETRSISGMSAVKLLTRLGMVNKPTKGLCQNILNLCKTSVVSKNATVHSSCWLAFGSLVHSYCSKDKRTCPDEFIQAIKAEYDKHLHTQDHHMTVIKNNEKLVVALKTIGNSGQTRLLPQLMHIITTWDDHNAIMIAAIEATRRMVFDDNAELLKVQQGLRDIYVNRSMCPEIRVVAFQELMKTGPTNPGILVSLTNTMRAEINPLMKQYIYTYLDTESKVKCPAKKSRKAAIDLLARTANIPPPPFELIYSFSKSFNMGGIPDIFSQGINLESVHTPISGIPRYLKMKHYMTVLGHYMEYVEHKARQREIIPLLRNLFGPYGMMEEKTSLWDIIRGKRSADDGFPDVYKRMQEMLDPSTIDELPFKVTLSSKMFGSEIAYLVLNDSHTFIQNLMKEGAIKIDKDWWSNTLKAGYKFNITANDILFDAMRKIPTSIGIPLKMKTNTAGVFAYGMYVDAKTSPMLNLLSLSNKPTEISANLRECYSLSMYTKSMAYVFFGKVKLGYFAHQNISHRCPVPIEKLTLNGQLSSQKYTIGSVISKKKYIFYDSSASFHRFVKVGVEHKKHDKVDWKAPQVSAMPGFGASAGQTSGGFQIPGLGQPGGPAPGWGPNAGGAGQSSGGPAPGWGPNAGGAGQSSGGPAPGWGPNAGGAGQSSGGPAPGWGPNAGGAGQSSGGPAPDVVMNSTHVHMGEDRASPSLQCIEAWNNSMKACIKTENETNTKMWYEPNNNVIEEIQIKYQNITKESDIEWKYLLELHVNGENDKKIAEYHLEFNTTKPPKDQPPMWDLFSGGIEGSSGGFSAKAYEKRNGVVTYMACLKSALDVPGRRWDLGVKWGKTCQQYKINISTVLFYEHGNPNMNVSIKWDSLPAVFERMTCPKKYMMEEMQRKMQEEMEKMNKQIGGNAGRGSSGGMGGGPGGMGGRPSSGMGGGPGGMGGGPDTSGGAGGIDGKPSGMGGGPDTSGGAGGMGGKPSGMGRRLSGGMGGIPDTSGGAGGMGGIPDTSGGAGGMGGIPDTSGGAGGMGGIPVTSGGAGGMGGIPDTSGGAGGMGGIPVTSGGAGGIGGPGLGDLPCFKGLDFKLSLKNSTTVELTGTLIPRPISYQLPFNGSEIFEKTKDIVLYGITETCKVHAGNEITTFDEHDYTYEPSNGCPHVVAKDCSKKDLFTVFMTKDDSNEKTYTLVIKDTKKKGHSFDINPDITVVHNGKPVQIAEGAEVNFPKVCKVTKRSGKLVIRCKAGVILEAHGGNLKIKVTPWYFGYMCGMCGNFNWLPYDDFQAPNFKIARNESEAFGTLWLVPGKTCNSGCKLVHRPDIQRPTGKLCISQRPVTHCAPNCQPTKQASATLPYHCLDSGTDEAQKVEQQITDKKYDEIVKAFRDKNPNMKEQADVHVDCQCTCPAL